MSWRAALLPHQVPLTDMHPSLIQSCTRLWMTICHQSRMRAMAETTAAETAAAPAADPSTLAPAATADSTAGTAGTSASDAPVPPMKRGQGGP